MKSRNKVVLAGGSGFVGHSLGMYLREHGWKTVVLGRRAGQDIVQWDGRTRGQWVKELDDANAVVNLAGRNINCRQTKSNRIEILESRMKSASVLLDAIGKCSSPPSVFIQCSAVGYYGDTEEACGETSGPGAGFLADVCKQLEATVTTADVPQTRKVILRLGVVLGREGGAFPLLKKAVRFFAGGRLGAGRQPVSWIHVDDLNRVFLAAIEDKSMAGVYNAVAPGAVANSEFMMSLRKVCNRQWALPVPALAVRLAALLAGSNSSLMLEGQCAVPERLLEMDFDFKYPDVLSAFRQSV